MRKGILTGMIVFGLSLFVASGLHASVEGAKAAFMRGQASEKAKNYKEAINEYQTALKEYPTYIYANKQLGNCYYYLGDKAKALKNYDIYLSYKKDDATTKAFADRLRQSVGGGDSQASESGSSDGKIAMTPSIYISPSLSYLTNDGSDMTGGTSAPGITVSSFVFDFDLACGYQMPNGFFAAGGYEYLARASTIGISIGGVSSSGAVIDVITESVFFVEPGYRFSLSRKIGLLGGLKLGYASESLTYGGSGYGGTGSGGTALVATGSGLIYEPEVGIQFLMGHRVGLNLNLGYRIDSITPSGTSVSGYTVSSSALPIVNSGVKVTLGMNIYFKRLID
jgi:hypothetical protein